MIDTDRFKNLATRGDWISLYAMLDDARDNATSSENIANELHWRIAALEWQKRHEEALRVLKANAHVYNAQSLVQHKTGRLLLNLGREKEALDEMSKAPIEEDMSSFSALAMDAKFFYFYLLARDGDASVKDRLSEIPDDYQYFRRDGTFLTKSDIADAAKKHLAADADQMSGSASCRT